MNRIKQLLAVTTIDLRSTVRNKTALFFGFLFPFIFIFIFGKLGEGAVVYDIAVFSNSNTDNPIYQTIENIEAFNLIENLSEDEINEQLEKGDLDSAIMIVDRSDGPVPRYELQLSQSVVNQEEIVVINSIIKGVIDQFNIKFAGLENPPIEFTVIEVAGREFTSIDFILPGQLAFGLMQVGVIGTAFLLVSLKETLVLKRFFATPLRRSDLLGGLGVSKLIFGLMQAVVIIGVGYFLLDFTLVNGFYTFIQMLIFSTFGLIIFLGFGFLISAISKDQNSVPPLANIITLPQFLLAGTFFPIELFPEWLQPISKILPLTYLNIALRKISFEGVPFSELYVEIAVLLIWGIAIYFLASRLFKWDR